jgi:hypothetical protein
MEPTIKDLLARVEAAEARAAAAEKAALQGQGQDVVGKIESKLESQAALDRKYAEVRKRNLEHMLPEARFRAQAKGNDTDLRQLIRDEIASMVAETPKAKPKKGAEPS